MIKILVFWDVYWRIWRAALKKELPILKHKYNPDFVIANVENITSGRWPIEKHIKIMLEYWVDIMTGWDHIFDNYKDIKDYLNKNDSKLIRPTNFYNKEIEWVWYKVFKKNNKKILVIHLLWESFMKHRVENPFLKINEILKEFQKEKLDWIILDFHAETTAEKAAMWQYIDWKISLIFGTHTHIQTNDEIILPNKTWFITDVWMNWPLYSIIWADFKSVEKRFISWISIWKITQCLDKNYVVNWLYVEIWDERKCNKIEKIRIRGKLVN